MTASPPCPVCGANRATTLTTAGGLRAYCLECFHGWRPSAQDFPYDSVSMCPLGSAVERLRAQINFFRPAVPDEAAILEIGCATGELARETRKSLNVRRYEAVELSPAADRVASVDVLHRTPLVDLVSAGSISGRFDLVIISHVLEHIEDIGTELAAIRAVLKPGGACFVEVPNRSGHVGLPFDDNLSHLHFFSAASLLRLLARAGLETMAVQSGAPLDTRYADSLRVMARNFALPAASPGLLSARLGPTDDKVVVWGAGSLVQEILANFFDAERIDFFVDRDPDKVGAELLGRPVRGPEALGDKPRTVLVNSIDFAGSITTDIAARYPAVAHRIVNIGDLLDGPLTNNRGAFS